MTETTLLTDIRLHHSRGDIRLFRNNVGRLRTTDGTWVQFGLCVGSSDLIGLQSLTITAEMVGKRIARFVAIEGKAEDARTHPERAKKQKAFIDMVNGLGGAAGIAHSVEDARRILYP